MVSPYTYGHRKSGGEGNTQLAYRRMFDIATIFPLIATKTTRYRFETGRGGGRRWRGRYWRRWCSLRPDAPEGSRGISLFLVPKVLVNEDGSLGERNGVACIGLEKKIGIHASPTCVMEYDGAKGWLVGEENRGLACMFTMMNSARLNVGLEGVGVGEAAWQAAWMARAGRAPGSR